MSVYSMHVHSPGAAVARETRAKTNEMASPKNLKFSLCVAAAAILLFWAAARGLCARRRHDTERLLFAGRGTGFIFFLGGFSFSVNPCFLIYLYLKDFFIFREYIKYRTKQRWNSIQARASVNSEIIQRQIIQRERTRLIERIKGSSLVFHPWSTRKYRGQHVQYTTVAFRHSPIYTSEREREKRKRRSYHENRRSITISPFALSPRATIRRVGHGFERIVKSEKGDEAAAAAAGGGCSRKEGRRERERTAWSSYCFAVYIRALRFPKAYTVIRIPGEREAHG